MMFVHGHARFGLGVLAALGLTGLLAAAAPRFDAQGTAGSAPCDITTSERIVAIGDVHGAYDHFRGVLRAAAIIDRNDRWIGGASVLVQTGDLLDRGPDSRQVLDLLMRLERDAARAGGRVFVLLGNHEIMRLSGDLRYVSAGERIGSISRRSAWLRLRES